MNRVFILPGEAKYTRQPMIISTLLGSCVSVCLYDSKNQWGGLNHYMLPYQESGKLAPGKYGDFAISSLLEVAERAGSIKRNLVASIFGGGKVTGHLGSMEQLTGGNVGERNVEAAYQLLNFHKIPIVREDLGGYNGRKIHMNTETNEIELHQIQRSGENVEKAALRSTFKSRRVKVLIVDDSATVRRLLRAGIELSDDMEVCGEAEDVYQAREMILERDPDVLCLDIIMPKMNGNVFLEKIMQYKPIPTVIVSTIAKQGSEMRQKVLDAGAVDVLDKEELEIYKGNDILRRVLLPKLRNAAETVVTKRSAG
jgi:chemotaxis receptor (MCP) glutamine deamidase CheD/CheY-like chemotaxis protein